MQKGLWACVFVAASVTPGLAQTIVINPTTVVFVASPDHNAVLTIGGQTWVVVERYELRLYLDGASSPLTTVNLLKPAPDAQNEIRATPTELIGLPLGAYVARVAAMGPGGEGVSDPTPPFARVNPPAAPTRARVLP